MVQPCFGGGNFKSVLGVFLGGGTTPFLEGAF